MREFSAKSLYTEYSCTGSLNKSRRSHACFAHVFDIMNKSKTTKYSINYKIYVYKGLDFMEKMHANNACLISKRELRHHLDQLRGIIPFKAVIHERTENSCPCYVISLTLENARGIQHKYILSWIRYAYEFPFNVILAEAIKLHKEKGFMFESVANLFNMVGGLFGLLGGGHSIPYGTDIGFLRRKQLAASMARKSCLNHIYECRYDGIKLGNSKISRYTRYDLEFWTNERLFNEERKPVYLERYKEIKQRRK